MADETVGADVIPSPDTLAAEAAVDNPDTDAVEPNERSSYEDVVQEIRDGKWGAKKARRERLIAAGYDYKAVMRELMK